MILHTIVDISDVIANGCENPNAPKIRYKSFGSGFMEYFDDGSGYRPVRIHSTNPVDYLTDLNHIHK